MIGNFVCIKCNRRFITKRAIIAHNNWKHKEVDTNEIKEIKDDDDMWDVK